MLNLSKVEISFRNSLECMGLLMMKFSLQLNKETS
jgi:hypothetical protein